MNKLHNVGIFGIEGYAGQTLAKLVLQHPELELLGGFSSKAEGQLPPVTIAGQEVAHYAYHQAASSAEFEACDVLFLATPPAVSMALMPLFAKQQKTVIDLSGAFRLSALDFQQWYQLSHQATDYIDQVTYGLMPWWVKKGGEKVPQLVANPGCYATCALMALIPLLKCNVVKPQHVIIDAKSGVSGAGKKAAKELLFCEIADNFFPYKVGVHQHIPEIKRYVTQYSGIHFDPIMVTHMLPINRGISMSIYLQAECHLHNDHKISDAIANAYHMAYGHYPLVKVGPINDTNGQTDHSLTMLKNVIGTPNTQIGYYVQQGKIYIVASIDNLLKGAASQAIENLNALFNKPLQTGLLPTEHLA